MAIYKVGADGKAPEGLKPGDQVVTGGGTYTIGGLDANGGYTGATKTSDTNTYNYKGPYDTVPSATAPQIPAATSQASYINSLYDAAQQSALASLKSAYDTNTATLNTQAAKIPQTYYNSENQVAANNATQRQSMNEQFAASGLNTGAGGQAQLTQNATYQNNIGSLEQAKAQALNDVETQRTTLATQYQNAIAEAIANNNYQRAQELYDEAVRVDNSIVSTAENQAALNYQNTNNTQSALQTQAETLAKYGDFSGYKALGYTDSQIANMSAAYQAATAAAAAAKKTGSSGSGSGTTDFSAVDAYAKSGGDPSDYLTANYKAMGYSGKEQAIAAYNVYAQQKQTTEAAHTGMYNNLLLLVDDANRRAQKLDDGSALVPTRIAQAVTGGGITQAQGAELLAKYASYGGK